MLTRQSVSKLPFGSTPPGSGPSWPLPLSLSPLLSLTGIKAHTVTALRAPTKNPCLQKELQLPPRQAWAEWESLECAWEAQAGRGHPPKSGIKGLCVRLMRAALYGSSFAFPSDFPSFLRGALYSAEQQIETEEKVNKAQSLHWSSCLQLTCQQHGCRTDWSENRKLTKEDNSAAQESLFVAAPAQKAV